MPPLVSMLHSRCPADKRPPGAQLRGPLSRQVNRRNLSPDSNAPRWECRRPLRHPSPSPDVTQGRLERAVGRRLFRRADNRRGVNVRFWEVSVENRDLAAWWKKSGQGLHSRSASAKACDIEGSAAFASREGILSARKADGAKIARPSRNAIEPDDPNGPRKRCVMDSDHRSPPKRMGAQPRGIGN